MKIHQKPRHSWRRNSPLQAIQNINPLKRVIVSTYQAAAGAAGTQELIESTHSYLANQAYTPQKFPHPMRLIFSVITRRLERMAITRKK